MFSNMQIDHDPTEDLCNMFTNMKIKKPVEYKINGDVNHDHIKELIEGKHLTKRVKKNSANKKDVTKWYVLTKNRYKTYKEFDCDPNEDHADVVKMIKQINKMFEENPKYIKMNILINLVYKVDSELKKKLMNWECIEKI